MMTNDLAIYLHIPFCTTKCTYCAFNTYTNMTHLIDVFVDALCLEIKLVGERNPYPYVKSVFWGGGTPTLLTPTQFERIFSSLKQYFPIDSQTEITTEANPNDLSVDYLVALRNIGINRLSIGMQSANVHELQLFARRHDTQTVIEVVNMARAANFDNINLDLIYGVPHQTIASWDATLSVALSLDVEHFSLYALGLEDGTPLKRWVQEGSMPTPDDDLAADMYERATDCLHDAGFEQYEISNWAKPGRACEHNLQYWRNFPYVGLGPGAHGYAGGFRYHTILSPQRYIKQLNMAQDDRFDFPYSPATAEGTFVDYYNQIAETLITSLRLIQEGVNRSDFKQRFSIDLMDYHGEIFTRFAQHKLVDITPSHIKLTRQGRLLSNLIFRELV